MADVGVGTVSAIRRYPVKSMLGEVLEAVTIVEGGVVGDRAYALVDNETGKVIRVKRPKRWGRLFEMSALTGPEVATGQITAGQTVTLT